MTKPFIALLTSLIILTSLSGCSLFSFGSDDTNVLEHAKDLLKGQLDEQGVPRKVDLPIRTHYTIAKKPMIDEELQVDFEFMTEQAIPVVRFALTTDEGLELVSSDFEEYYKGLKVRQIIKHSISVLPKNENKFYINLYVVTEIGDDKKAKEIKIPIAIGDYSLKDNPEPR